MQVMMIRMNLKERAIFLVEKMKKILFLLYGFVLVSGSLFSYSMSDFEELPQTEQIELWLTTYENDDFYFSRLTYAKTVGYFMEIDDKESLADTMEKKLKSLTLTSTRSRPYSFTMLSEFLFYYYWDSGYLSSSQTNTFLNIITSKLDEYISNKQVIDITVIFYTSIIESLKTGEFIQQATINPLFLFNVYHLKYEDLIIDWEGIEKRYQTSRNQYESSVLTP